MSVSTRNASAAIHRHNYRLACRRGCLTLLAVTAVTGAGVWLFSRWLRSCRIFEGLDVS